MSNLLDPPDHEALVQVANARYQTDAAFHARVARVMHTLRLVAHDRGRSLFTPEEVDVATVAAMVATHLADLEVARL